MRRIAIINQKGGVGKTTTAVNLGAALARNGRRVLVIDMDPQANASMNLGVDLKAGDASTYSVLVGTSRVADAVRRTATEGLWILPAHLDLSGAELELASAIGRESILGDALDDWVRERTARDGEPPVDYVFIDNPPSLGLLSVNGLAAANEVLISVQTEFFALQGLSKLVEVVQLLRRRLNPDLEITGVLGCLYDSRLRLAREVLAELRAHFPDQCFQQTVRQNVKLAECPSFSQTIFEYAPDSTGARDHLRLAAEVIAREGRDPELAARYGGVAGPARATAAGALGAPAGAGAQTAEETPDEGPPAPAAAAPDSAPSSAPPPASAEGSAASSSFPSPSGPAPGAEPAGPAFAAGVTLLEPLHPPREPSPAQDAAVTARREERAEAPPELRVVELRPVSAPARPAVAPERAVALAPRGPRPLPVLDQRAYRGEERAALPGRAGPRRA